jgi:hypothetical protein
MSRSGLVVPLSRGTVSITILLDIPIAILELSDHIEISDKWSALLNSSTHLVYQCVFKLSLKKIFLKLILTHGAHGTVEVPMRGRMSQAGPVRSGFPEKDWTITRP